MSDLKASREQFLERLVNQDRAGGMKIIDEALASDTPPGKILLEVVEWAMTEIGRQQARQEVTLSEVYVIAKIGDEAISHLLSLMPEPPVSAGTVVIGTAQGDYHGLGRKIVASFLRAAGFEVHDLGMSVSGEQFVEAAVEKGASVICISALLLHTARRAKDVRDLLKERKLEGQIKLMVGGAALNFDKRLYREIGADATATNAAEAALVTRYLVNATKKNGDEPHDGLRPGHVNTAA